MTASSAVTAVRPAFGDKFFSSEVCRSCSARTGAAKYFYIIDEVGGGQSAVFFPEEKG